jgi:hypothetical protein
MQLDLSRHLLVLHEQNRARFVSVPWFQEQETLKLLDR